MGTEKTFGQTVIGRVRACVRACVRAYVRASVDLRLGISGRKGNKRGEEEGFY